MKSLSPDATFSRLDRKGHQFTYAALFILAACLFTSMALTALFHVLILFPALYFSWKSYKEKTFLESTSSKFLAAIIGFSMLSVFANWNAIDDPFKHLSRVKYYLLGGLSIYAFRSTLRGFLNQKRIRLLIHIFLVSVSIASLYGLMVFFTHYNPLNLTVMLTRRASGMYGQLMSYAYGLGMLIPVMMAGLFNYKKIQTFASIKILTAATLINLVGLYFTFTRGGMIGLIVALPFILFFTHRKISLLLIGLGALMVAAVIYVSVNQIDLGFYRFDVASKDCGRIGMAMTALKMGETNPLTGVGFRNVSPRAEDFQDRYDLKKICDFQGHAHNNYLEALAATGVLGFLSFGLFIAFWGWELIKKDALINRLILPFLVSFAVSGLFQCTITDGENAFLVMAAYAIFQAQRSKPS